MKIVLYSCISLIIVYSITATCPGSLPSGCICSELLEANHIEAKKGLRVICASLKLTSIPTGIPPETQELVLENNQITTLPKNAFGSQILPDLTTLILSGNGLSSIASDAFLVSGSSNSTTTPALKTLDLSTNELSKIPEIPCDLMPNLSYLDISTNKFTSTKFPDSYAKCSLLQNISLSSNQGITSLGKDDLKNLKAKPLRLELGNSISTIEEDAFTPVKSVLSTLELSENPFKLQDLKNALMALSESSELSSLSLNSLRGDDLNGSLFMLLESFSAPNLKSLSLNSNPVHVLDGAFGSGMRSLSNFECDSCLIERVDAVFKSATQLNRVMLRRNRLTSVPSTLQPTLQHLYLDSNPIALLNSNDFSNYKQLLELSLDSTRLMSVASDTFSGLKKLQTLILSNALLNKSILISGGNVLFKGLESLQVLSLSENPIPVALLTDGALAALTKLRTLQLANSSLQYVPRKAFDQWPKLEEVDLRDNPFNCDANLKELYDWLQDVTQNFTAPDAQAANFGPNATQILVRGYRSYVCASPPPCVNVRLADPTFYSRLAQCSYLNTTTTTGPPPSPSTSTSITTGATPHSNSTTGPLPSPSTSTSITTGATPHSNSTTGPPSSTLKPIPTSTLKPTTEAPSDSSEAPHSSKVWLTLLLTALGIVLVTAIGVAGCFFYRRRRRFNYQRIEDPVN